MRRQKQLDPIPGEFSSYEEAAEFWDTMILPTTRTHFAPWK